MAKAKRRAEGDIQPNYHVTPEGPVTAAAVIDVASTTNPEPSQPVRQDAPAAATLVKSAAATLPKDPFAIETINTPDNALHLGNSRQRRTFLIRFDNNPNEGRGKDDPHPVLALLKQAGYQYRAVPNDGMAWQKPWSSDQFSARDEMDARKVAHDAGVLLGGQVAKAVAR